MGSLAYLVKVGRQLRYVRIDHLLQTRCMYPEEAFEEEVLDKDTVPEMTQTVCSSVTSPAVLAGAPERKTRVSS